MTEPSLSELEQEVVAARARLARDLTTLRAPSTMATFSEELKQQAVATKDEWMEKARSAVQERVHGAVETIKARAAENPAAVLAIGAGLAWRMLRHPPIATALVGFGLFSLMRANAAPRPGFTDADYLDHAKARLRAQSADVAAQATSALGSARETAGEWSARAASRVQEQAGRLADAASETLSRATEQVTETAVSAAEDARRGLDTMRSDVTSAVRDQVDGLTGTARSALSDTEDRFRDDWGRAEAQAAQAADRFADATSGLENLARRPDTTDRLLLGVAGVAVAAALGAAVQRRIGELEKAG